MVNYARIQHHIDKGLGKAGQKLGEPYTAYRIGSTSTGDFPAAWTQLATNVPIMWRRITDQKLASALRAAGSLYADLIADMEPYLLGDVFVNTDPPYRPGVSYGAGATSVPGTNEIYALALAWHQPIRRPTGVWLNRLARVYRPAAAPANMTDANTGQTSQYWKETLDNDQPLQLASGTYHWGVNGQPASLVPIGLGSTERPARGMEFPPSVPGISPVSRWYVYIPPLPGYAPTEGDAIVMDNDARYVVLHPYEQSTGLVGSQLAVERHISQVA